MKTDNEIEQLLMSGKKLSLSSQEKASIKSALLEHAMQTLKHEQRLIRSPWSSWVMRGSVSFASLLMVFVGTAYASQDSLPGEPLYAMKVHVVEEMIALTKTDPSEHVAYDISLMETRLTELQALASQEETPSQEDLAALTDQIDEHVADITATLDTTETSIISHKEKIKTLAQLSSIAKAQVKIAENENNLSLVTETVQDTHDTTSDSLTSAVRDFTDQQSAGSVNDYLSDQITDVSEQLHASTTDSDTRDVAERHLHDVDEALTDGDTEEALISILEAQEVINVDAYLDKEGEVKGVETTESNEAENF